MATPVRLKVDTSGFAKLEAGLDEMLARLRDRKTLMQRIGNYMVSSTRSRITREKTSPDGVPWAPLTKLTEELKAKDGAHPQDILFHWGTLSKSIYVSSITNDRVYVTADTKRGGASKNYAPYMQRGVRKTGGKYKNKQIPARPFLGISETNKKRIMQMVKAYVAGNQHNAE